MGADHRAERGNRELYRYDGGRADSCSGFSKAHCRIFKYQLWAGRDPENRGGYRAATLQRARPGRTRGISGDGGGAAALRYLRSPASH